MTSNDALVLRNARIDFLLKNKEFNTRTEEELKTYTDKELRDEIVYIDAIKQGNETYEQSQMRAYGGPKNYAEHKRKMAEIERIKKEKALENATPKISLLDKKTVERYMSKNYSRVKDINAPLEPGQVYYIIKKQDTGEYAGRWKPFRYECPKTGPCKICPENPNEVCELWKKTGWGKLTGESAEKYTPYINYTPEEYLEYEDMRIISKNGEVIRDGTFMNGIVIKNGVIYPPGSRRGGKPKRKTKRKHCKSKRKGKGSKRHKTRRHSKK